MFPIEKPSIRIFISVKIRKNLTETNPSRSKTVQAKRLG